MKNKNKNSKVCVGEGSQQNFSLFKGTSPARCLFFQLTTSRMGSAIWIPAATLTNTNPYNSTKASAECNPKLAWSYPANPTAQHLCTSKQCPPPLLLHTCRLGWCWKMLSLNGVLVVGKPPPRQFKSWCSVTAEINATPKRWLEDLLSSSISEFL